MPVIMFAAFAALGLLLDSKLPPTVGTVAVLDASGSVERHAREELANDRINAVEFDGKRIKETSLPAPPAGAAQPLVPRIDLTLEFPRDPAQEQALRRAAAARRTQLWRLQKRRWYTPGRAEDRKT